MKTRKRDRIYSYFGYDPIDKHFKVLSMTMTTYPEYQVMTLGTRKILWRKVECGIPHYPESSVMICINGVLYYRSCMGKMIVCFDIRHEKFNFVNVGYDIAGDFPHNKATLINFNGKLGSLITEGCRISGCATRFVVWILEDIEKHEWSKRVYVLPPMWKNVVGYISLDFVGVIGTNEFVFSSLSHSPSFYLFYYNIERNTVKRVEIQGMEAALRGYANRVFCFSEPCRGH